MKPLRPLLGTARTVLLAPDGELHLLPFGALRDEKGRWLLQDWTFAYLGSGRDLLRMAPVSAKADSASTVSPPSEAVNLSIPASEFVVFSLGPKTA